MEKAAATATRRCNPAMHTTRGTRIAVAIGLEHARLGREQLGVQTCQTIELGVAVGTGGRAGVAGAGLRFAARHGRGMPGTARGTRGVVRTPGTVRVGMFGGRATWRGSFGSAAAPVRGFGSPGFLGMGLS